MSVDFALKQVKDSIMLDTATGRDLTRLGQNYGVPRPRYNSASDDLFRTLIGILAWKPKMILSLIYELLETFFGTTAGWKVFEIRPNEIIIEMHNDLYAGTLRSATYLQQDPTPPSTTVITADVSAGGSSVDITDRTGFADPAVTLKDEYAYLGRGPNQERFRYDTLAPLAGVTGRLSHATVKFAKFHFIGAPVEQFIPEPDSTSYAGDYFGVAIRLGTLAAGIVGGVDSTATLTAGHNFPSACWLWFEEAVAARREKRYCTVIGNAVTIIDFDNALFTSNHAIGTEVKYYDRLASHNEDSVDSSNNNPIMLSADTLILDFLHYLDIVKAAGVEVTIKRIG